MSLSGTAVFLWLLALTAVIVLALIVPGFDL